MIANNIDIFKNKKVIGDIIPIHSQTVINAHEHFNDGDKFITVSRDGSVAVTNSETLDVVKFEKRSKHDITASEMIDLCGEKKLLLGNIPLCQDRCRLKVLTLGGILGHRNEAFSRV